MIDLHTHTSASDGSVSPPDLIRLASQSGLQALAITDHDTLDGCDEGAPVAAELGMDLIAGIELSTRLESNLVQLVRQWLGSGRLPSVHLLGYFLVAAPPRTFRSWILIQQESRHQRNRRLVENLRAFGFDITLAEVTALGGKLAGRPHFAEILLRKGYVGNRQQAFDCYLGDNGQAAAERAEPGLLESIRMLRQNSAFPVLAHPARLPFGNNPEALRVFLEALCTAGLQGLEVWHSEHSPTHQALYARLAKDFCLEATGGSDFHGSHKPSVLLGSGINGNICIPKTRLDSIRSLYCSANAVT